MLEADTTNMDWGFRESVFITGAQQAAHEKQKLIYPVVEIRVTFTIGFSSTRLLTSTCTDV
jgi:hypothetical protein